jgi:hypothetical protein
MEDKSHLSSHMVHSTETEESESKVKQESNAPVFVKLEMSDDLERSTANNQYNAIYSQNGTIKTEPFNHQNIVCDDDTVSSYSDTKHIMESCKHEHTYEEDTLNVMAHHVGAGTSVFVLKREYKYVEDGTPGMTTNVEEGTSVLVKSEIPVDPDMPTS